jgi:hypothetical protein
MLAKYVRPVTGAPLHDSVSYPVGHCPVQRPAGQANAATWVAGLHRLTLADPVDSRPMQALVFYPSSGEARPVRIEGYQTRLPGRTVAMGRFPVGDLPRQYRQPHGLARPGQRPGTQGFVVVAVIHPGDKPRSSRLGTLSNLYGRPLQVSAAITAARADWSAPS